MGNRKVFPQIFIVGMSRGGTTWLSRILNGHPDVAVVGETMFWGRYYEEPNANGHYDTVKLAAFVAHLKNEIPATAGPKPGGLRKINKEDWASFVDAWSANLSVPITPADLFKSLMATVADAEKKTCVIEKTPHHVNYIDRILWHLPEAKFIILVRGAYSFMLSYKHQGDRKRTEVRDHFKKLYHPLGCALVWRGYYRSAASAYSLHSRRSLRLLFESLANDSLKALREVETFLGLEDCSLRLAKDVDRNSSFNENAKPKLSSADVFWMNLISKAEMHEFGEVMQPVSLLSWDIYKSFLVLPLWAIRTFLYMLSCSTGNPLNYLLRIIRR